MLGIVVAICSGGARPRHESDHELPITSVFVVQGYMSRVVLAGLGWKTLLWVMHGY